MRTTKHAWLGIVAVTAAAWMMAGCGDGGGSSGGSGGTGGSTASGGTTSSGGSTGGSTGGTTSSGGTGGTGGGTVCGGLAGIPCGADEYCDYQDDRCGADDGTGVCTPKPQGCPDIYMPVCTCAGMVAGNDCDAASSGQDISVLGGCTAPDGMFPCGAGFCDKATSYCQRTTSDVAGYPDSFSCMELPAACSGGAPTCACLSGQSCADMCTEADGGLTLTCPGG